uniref:Uncharacterized protein n=1 Tax=Glossina pallidipes TaxID=7398 RepID=A0A1B0AE75_GLOPL
MKTSFGVLWLLPLGTIQSGSICVNLGGPVVQVVQLNGYMSIGLCILAHIVFRRPLPKHPERKTQKTTTITTIIITATTKQTVTTTTTTTTTPGWRVIFSAASSYLRKAKNSVKDSKIYRTKK